MLRSISVIIPTLNEAGNVAAAIASASEAGEVIVADGGSTDDTVTVAANRGARIVRSIPNRGRQLNDGARAANGAGLIFLHADTILPPLAIAQVTEALNRGARFGAFSLRFRESSWRLRLAERMINLRTRLTRCPWGDQAQFIDRELFVQSGGFREFPIMEDYELAIRMKRQRAGSVILDDSVETSGRRFLQRGIWRTTVLNWSIVLDYRRGVKPEKLAERYRS